MIILPDNTTTQTPFYLRTLASGSSGNATYLRFGTTRILVDAGVSYGRIRDGLASFGESVDDLSALLLTHEHSDHVKGVQLLSEKHPDLAVFATAGTIEGCRDKYGWSPQAQVLSAGQKIEIGALSALPFRTSHDARESVGYRFDAPGFALGYATDLGQVTANVVESLKSCQALFLEANYDEELLRWSPYPAFLKRRISGRGGHLSNRQMSQLLQKVACPELETVVLCHLSEKNNSPARALAAAQQALPRGNKVSVVAAERHQPGALHSFRARVRAEQKLPRQGELPI